MRSLTQDDARETDRFWEAPIAALRAHSGPVTYALALSALLISVLLVTLTDSPFTSWRPDDALLIGVIFVLGMLVIERASLVIEGERQTHTISIAEMLLILGAVFLSPVIFIGLRVTVGTYFMVSRHTDRRKLYFNLTLFAMEAALLSFLVRAFLSEFPTTFAQWSWVAVSSALMSLTTLAWVSLVISLHERHHSFAVGVRSQGFAMLVGSSCGVLIASSGTTYAALVLFSIPVIAAVTWLLQAYGNLSQGHQELEHCYQFSRDLAAMPFLDDVIDETLQQSKSMLRGETARLIVLAAPDGSFPVEYVFDGKTRSRAQRLDDLPVWLQFVGGSAPVVVVADSLAGDSRSAFERRGIQGAMISSVESRGLSALLIITDRLGRRGVDFTDRDRDLFAHVTSNAVAQLSVGYVLRELEDSTLKDSLTGLGNRRRFESHLEEYVDHETVHAMFIVDLVGLENVNDTLGHDNGEIVVVELARRLEEIAGPDWALARFQSGEFAIAVPEIVHEGAAMNLVQRVQDAISRPLELDGTNLEVASQVGIAFFPEHGRDIQTVIRRADIAAESAKYAPTSRLIYSSEIDDRSPRRLAMARELRVAIEKRELEVYYQPKALLATGEVIGVEALCRWTHPTLGSIRPDEFIEVAERTHLIGPLTELVLSTSLDAQVRWLAEGLNFPVAVNLSPLVLLDPTLPDRLEHELAVRGLSSAALTLELTETRVMGDDVRSTDALSRLDQLGIRLSIDDFGTGYSSLAYLKGLPVSELKIDRSFVAEAMADGHSGTIVASTIDLARGLGLSVVAEGVEDRTTWEWLDQLGCNHMQGFYLSRPQPEEEFLRWVRQYQALRQAEEQVTEGPVRAALPAPRTRETT